jgi:hypothetical protein
LPREPPKVEVSKDAKKKPAKDAESEDIGPKTDRDETKEPMPKQA